MLIAFQILTFDTRSQRYWLWILYVSVARFLYFLLREYNPLDLSVARASVEGRGSRSALGTQCWRCVRRRVMLAVGRSFGIARCRGLRLGMSMSSWSYGAGPSREGLPKRSERGLTGVLPEDEVESSPCHTLADLGPRPLHPRTLGSAICTERVLKWGANTRGGGSTCFLRVRVNSLDRSDRFASVQKDPWETSLSMVPAIHPSISFVISVSTVRDVLYEDQVVALKASLVSRMT